MKVIKFEFIKLFLVENQSETKYTSTFKMASDTTDKKIHQQPKNYLSPMDSSTLTIVISKETLISTKSVVKNTTNFHYDIWYIEYVP